MSLVKQCDTDDQLKYVYHHSNKIPIVSKSIVILITALLFTIKPSISIRVYYSLLTIGFILIFNSIKINHQKFISVNKHLGIEIQESSGILQNNINHRFIPNNRVLEVVINEGAQGLQYIFYLAIIVEDLDKLVLVFPLIQIRSDVRNKLFISDHSQKTTDDPSETKIETPNEKEERIKNTKICKYLCEE